MKNETTAKESHLNWQGLMTTDDHTVRRATVAVLALLSAAMVATQTNYFVVGDAHVINVLAPIAACALLAGPKAAMFVGAVAGAAEWLHATLLPLDAYEQYFATPVNSVILFAFIGLIMGLMYAESTKREYDRSWKGIASLLVACVIGSVVFTVLFTISTGIINSLVNLEIPHNIVQQLTGNKELFSQILANSILMGGLVFVMAVFWYKRNVVNPDRTLSQRFQGWLFAVVMIAYLITAAATYTAVSVVCRASAESQMQSQIDYLTGQLQERDKMLDGIARRTGISDAKLEELHESTIGGVATGLPLGERGISAVGEDGTIVSASRDDFTGRPFEEVVGAGFAFGFDPSIYEDTRSTVWYMDGGELGYLRATELAYVRVTRRGSYQIMAALPQVEVYRWRPILYAAVSLVFLALFAAIYTQAAILLKNVVVRDIDETNETLGRITGGELDQSVQAHGTVEFARLSAGINATVGSLRAAIAAEAARNDRDLATAKAIQESALPRTFPPFPELQTFDVYASMNAAREVGGDFYDIFIIDESHVGFLIADVSGKGIPASLFMMAAKTEIANNIQAGMDLAIAMQTANWHLCQGNDAGMFVTVWAAVLNHETGELSYVNAGHNPPLLRRDGAWEWLTKRGGLFMGTFETAKYRSSELTLGYGDELFLYTDGVNEAFSVNEEQYGDKRLEAFLQHHANLHPHALVDAMRAELRDWAIGAEQSDDITMLALEYGVPPEATGSIELDAKLESLDEAFTLIRDELAARHCPITVQRKVDVALEELFVNVCRYAYKSSGKVGRVRVEYVYNANPSTITVGLTDWGVPFNPLAYGDPKRPKNPGEAKVGGLGILMAKRSTDDLSYVRDGDANVVVFRKSW